MGMIDRALFSLPGARRVLAFLTGCAGALGLLAVGQGLALARAITVLWEGQSLGDAACAAALFLTCFLARQLVRNIQDARMERYACKRADALRRDLLAVYYDEGPRLLQRLGTGAAATVALEGVDRVQTYLELMLPKLAAVAIVPAIVLIQVLALDWISGIIALVAFPTTILFMVILGQTAQERAVRQHAEFQRLSNHFIDTLRGLETLRLFGRSRSHGTHVFAVSERFRTATVKTLSVGTLSSAVLDLIATFGLAAVAIMLGFRLSDGTLSLFPALAVLILVPEYFAPLRDFAADFHATLDGKNALSQVNGVLAEAKVGEGVDRGTKDEVAVASDALGDGSEDIAPWGPESTLELRGVSFSYASDGNGPRSTDDGSPASAPESDVLSDITLAVRGFARVGIVGLSGAGKSTLTGILAGFESPTGGDILVNGRQLSGLRRSDWQRQVAYIPQNPHLFHASLRENIAWYRPDADEETIQNAVIAVGLDALARELPAGLDTVIGEGGRTLSGGEAHRVALARAVLDPARRIWILDEPTAHLDIETELELKERLLPLFEGRLVIFATHRLHWVRNMDTVLVLENGHLVAAGTPGELAAHDGGYLRLAHAINEKGGEPREA